MKKIFWFLFLFVFSASVFAQVKKHFAVTFEGEPVFFVSKDLNNRSAKVRAEEATKLLSHAIESKAVKTEGPLVRVENKKTSSYLYVRDTFITSIFNEDAEREGISSAKEYSDTIKGKVETIVERELERQKWQKTALRFFISVILAVFGILVIRQLKRGFDHLENLYVEERISLKKIRISGRPLFRSDNYAGILTLVTEIFRWFSYVAIVLIILVTILSQYPSSRGYLRLAGKATLEEIFSYLQAITSALPGIILCGLILLSLHISIHAFNLMLAGSRSKKSKKRTIPSHRIPVFKTLVPVLLFIVFLPFAVAAFFQRYDTPMQWLVVGSSLILVLGALPLVATWICGAVFLWRDEFKEGDWVSINGVIGEIAQQNNLFLYLVPLHGGRISVPMSRVFLSSIKKLSRAPRETIRLKIKRDVNTQNVIELLKSELQKTIEDIEIAPLEIFSRNILLELRFQKCHADVKYSVMLQVLDLANRGDLEFVD